MATAWERDLGKFTAKLDGIAEAMVPAIGAAVMESIQVGSPITGAPGQPVDTGFLRNSWQIAFPSKERAEITTKTEYAEAIEDGVGRYGPMQVRSPVGGFHSVALTRMNFDRLVDHVLNSDLRPAGFQDNHVLAGGET